MEPQALFPFLFSRALAIIEKSKSSHISAVSFSELEMTSQLLTAPGKAAGAPVARLCGSGLSQSCQET